MKKTILALAFLASCVAFAAVRPYGTLPTPAHLDFHKREIIAIVHWGPNTYTGQEWGFGNVPPKKLAPDALDPDQWVEAMAAGGIKAVVLVCKHHDGFCLWPSPLNKDYSMSAVPGKYKGFDVVKAVETACRKRGLEFGAYLSPWDRRQGNYGKPEYVEYFHNQWDELMTNYGDICEIWLDGANGGSGWYGGANGGKGERRSIPPGYYQKGRLRKSLNKKHPRSVAFGGHGNWSIRWCGNEKGTSPETWWNPAKGDDGKEYWQPSEADTPLRQGWFFHANQHPKPMTRLVDMYFESVGRGAVLNLGIAPDKHGRVCDEDVVRLREFGDWVRNFNSRDFAADAKRSFEKKDNALVETLVLPSKRRFNSVDMKEKIELGQRIESFFVEVDDGSGWRKVAEGTTIGYRRLARFPEVTADKVRVTLNGRAEPQMHNTALRFAQAPDWKPEPLPADLLPSADWKVVRKACLYAADCRKRVTMKGFEYVPPEGAGVDGLVSGYSFEVSDDGNNWSEVKTGEFGNIAANPIRTRIAFDKPVTARYFRMKATSILGGGDKAAIESVDLW